MTTLKLAEQVAEKIKALPNDKRQEVLKSIESFVAEATRDLPRKYAGVSWNAALAAQEMEEPRPNVWRFTTVPHPTSFTNG